MTASFHRLAMQELVDAASHYEQQRSGLGADFIAAVQEAVDFIAAHPQAAPLVTPHARRLVMRRFPYNVIYSWADDEVRVLAVAHHRRSPEYWVGRG